MSLVGPGRWRRVAAGWARRTLAQVGAAVGTEHQLDPSGEPDIVWGQGVEQPLRLWPMGVGLGGTFSGTGGRKRTAARQMDAHLVGVAAGLGAVEAQHEARFPPMASSSDVSS